MSKRVTIVITKENEKAIRKLQSKMIATTTSGWSFSKIINLVLDSGAKSNNLNKKLKLLEKDLAVSNEKIKNEKSETKIIAITADMSQETEAK